VTDKAELEVIGELASAIWKDAEAQLVFSRARPARSLEACDAELDRLLDNVALLAKFITVLTRAALNQEPRS